MAKEEFVSISLRITVLKGAIDDLMKEYGWLTPDVGSPCISKIGQCDESAPENKKNNFCILIALIRPLPAHRSLPETYEGFKVFSTVVGEATAHQEEE